MAPCYHGGFGLVLLHDTAELTDTEIKAPPAAAQAPAACGLAGGASRRPRPRGQVSSLSAAPSRGQGSKQPTTIRGGSSSQAAGSHPAAACSMARLPH